MQQDQTAESIPHRQDSIKKILMIKSHSMGIGDLLRSSAAWRALKDHWPEVELHLVFLSKHPGYAVEEIIKSHHLLSSATFITMREGSPHIANAKRVPYRILKEQIKSLSNSLQPDLVIDFEASGLRTTFLTRIAANACSAKTVGISQFPGRGFLYDISAPSTSQFASRRQLALPMDYTNRDFVALSALGIERQGRPIELNLSDKGKLYAKELKRRLATRTLNVGLNIGCGTLDAIHKRPPIDDLVECVGFTLQQVPHNLLLSGASFEKDINQAFIKAYASRWGDTTHIFDLAGETSLDSLTGLIDVCDIFTSTDSGPYHMSVAMQKPTLVWFTYDEVTSFHNHPWCSRVTRPQPEEFRLAFNKLLPQ